MAKSVLIAGTGPVAVQLAVLLKRHTSHNVDMVGRGRETEKSRQFWTAYQAAPELEVRVQNEMHASLAGTASLGQLYDSYEAVLPQYDVLVLACTADAYSQVIQQLPSDVRQRLKHVILVSPTFGSHMIVQQQLSTDQPQIEVVSFSTYLGDTGVPNPETPHRVLTKGVKKHLYLGTTHAQSDFSREIVTLMAQVQIPVTTVAHPLMAESRNSSLYVHPALFMNEHALKAVFEGMTVPFYVYKLFPEGPITMRLIAEMRQMWQEVMAILQRLNIDTLNLLKFMVKENYPLRPETMDEARIEGFETLSPIEQEYLLYVRYTGILIDPFSEPDDNGKYFDFSAVPFNPVFQNEQGIWHIPRMPSEDYYRTQMMRGMARTLDIATPMMDTLIERYEAQLTAFQQTHVGDALSSQFTIQSFEEDIARIAALLNPDE
ncbi:staphylopine biosynthesis dehydrogenase [Staphylococcus delphini]|uniref:staphylopine biosynthesis dehydrogenase n=1 Tax=Staphylococcus delphini TaxID=53344 RepID=UPI001363FD1F|nr:staphylopine biosynthesis dehydrogenase [Staphylococcus delphini]NBK47246.1 staphylopine biosynthesis dehydrogenase [Staphylococcus delphini]